MAVNVGFVDYFIEFERFFPPKGKQKCGMVERPRVSGLDNYFEIWTDTLALQPRTSVSLTTLNHKIEIIDASDCDVITTSDIEAGVETTPVPDQGGSWETL